ncbi:MAG: hypothetical protein FWF24_04085 [Alphaproteobacteria bacterium]|nr:hypothetical protein [Alphaproteobacteria bacterium]
MSEKNTFSDEETAVLKDLAKAETDKRNEEEHQKKEDDRIFYDKQVEWYSVLAEASVTTRFERDRQLLTIAALAIGALITLKSDIDKDFLTLGFWLLSAISFMVTIIVCLNIFQKNTELLEALIAETAEPDRKHERQRLDAALGLRDKIMYFSFIFGIILMFAFAIKGLGISLYFNS